MREVERRVLPTLRTILCVIVLQYPVFNLCLSARHLRLHCVSAVRHIIVRDDQLVANSFKFVFAADQINDHTSK